MKKVAVLLLAVLILMSGVAVRAAGGTAADPMIGLGYLNGTWLPSMTTQAAAAVDAKTQLAYQSALDGLKASHGAYVARAGGTLEYSGALTDRRVKRGDVVTMSAGSGVLLLAGSAAVGYTTGGAVVDVTAGETAASGGNLTPRHRYLSGEQTTAAVTITSDTAVLSLEGYFTFSPSAAMDYNALADGLKAMGMFKGSGTAYGSGYELELAPTRIQGLIMFLRLIGEEDAALAYTGANPFVDAPVWCQRYVAYAAHKGYAKGVGVNAAGKAYFSPNTAISAGEYMTFVLRALGYTDSGAAPDFSWQNAVGKSLAFGVINAAEQKLLTTTPFLRAQVAYVSYFSLSAPVKGGGSTLLQALITSGSLDGAAVGTVMAGVAVERLV